MRLDFYDGSIENRFSRTALKLTMSAAALLLAMPTPLPAQSSDRQISGYQESSESIAPVGCSGCESLGRELDTNAVAPLVGISNGFSGSTYLLPSVSHQPLPMAEGDRPHEGSKPPSVVAARNPKSGDLNREVFYKNRLEFSFDGGWLPINIPFVFDVFLGDGYNRAPLNYTLVPLIFSLRWQMDNVGGPWIFRGNWDLTTSGGVTLIPRGPETRYFAWIMGIRRNFVPRGRIAPYFDGRLGLGDINAKGPLGVLFAQGQDFTFTVNMGSGIRYNLNPRYSVSAGLNWMHISNLYLSQPKFANYGINVYGPMFGIDVRLGKPRLHSSE